MSEAQEKEIYDLKQTLGLFRSLCMSVELPRLIQFILYTSMAQGRVTGAGLFVRSAMDSSCYKLDINYMNLDLNPVHSFQIKSSSPIVKRLTEFPKAYSLAEVEPLLTSASELEMIRSIKPSLIVPLVFRRRLYGILVLGERISLGGDSSLDYSDYEKKEILSIASFASIALNNAFLVEISSTDMMTRLKFKYYFYNVLSDRMESVLESKGILSVLMFDIDFFKKVNDEYGHNCGDYILTKVASLIKNSIRSKDLAARYGGEEFVVLLNNAGCENAKKVADRIRKKVEAYDFVYQGKHLKITVSGGAASFSQDINSVVTPEELVEIGRAHV